MKRRSFIRGAVAAIAIGLSPAFLNKTSLEIAGLDLAKGESIGTLVFWKMYPDGSRELIGAKEVPVVDRGINSLYQGKKQFFHFPEECNINEIGTTDGRLVSRHVFDEPMTFKAEDHLVIEYDYRVS
jgi:hypothetical protein